MNKNDFWEYTNKQKKKNTNIKKRHHNNMLEYELELERERYERKHDEEIYHYCRKIG